MHRSGHRPVLLAAPALGLVLAACGSTLEQDELETQVAAALEQEAGVRPEVSCPSDLDAVVDATTQCSATDPQTGRVFAFRITVTSVEDGIAHFDVSPAQ
ncbi:DUF4333 domain-containing protein [Geodermatophilus sp. TF02-6]|uniref:DUF4333 domain-containing protein n=1 Tax=Geodermatophilus sp. TF02-6 TaxID=2250575 RepID=UPI00131466EF|nr:DUF4333 domain-containing protein [Geodermatophilus sp. TF02-6]